MPARAPSRCPCGVVTPSGSLCPCRARRRQAVKAQADARRPNAAARGYCPKWTAARKDFLAEHPRCVRCEAPSTVVDHITPHQLAAARTEDQRAAALKLFWRRSNWQALCTTCHSRAKQAEERRDD